MGGVVLAIESINKSYEIIEKNLEQIESIISSKFVLGQDGKIIELHIVSNGERNPKQLSRDIQSVLIATYDIAIDYKKISIAEIPEKIIKRNKPRLKIETISHEKSRQKSSIKVVLSDEKGKYTNCAEGVNTLRNIERMLVEATLKDVEEACGYKDKFILEDIKSIQMSTDKAVLVVIMCLVEGVEKRMSGSCLVNNDYNEAVVKATLDAINRCISK